MAGLLFQDAQSPATLSPNRADIACFVGFVARRRTPVPTGVSQWLKEQSWPVISLSLQKNRLLYPATLSPGARAWLLSKEWPTLPADVLAQASALGGTFATEITTWLLAQGWPTLNAPLLANEQLDPTPIDSTVRTWLLANGWSQIAGGEMPALDLVASGTTWLAYTAVPTEVKTWLHDNGWRALGTTIRDDDPLQDVPVPLESFEAFDQLFAWESRPPQPHAFPFATWLGAAVRSFFTQGGARCFVTRVGDPAPYEILAEDATDAERTAHLDKKTKRLRQLLPGLGGSVDPKPWSRNAPETWKGLGVLLGLEEAAFACLPDLPELVADAALHPTGLEEVAAGPEVFSKCTPSIALPPEEVRQVSSAPACTETGYLRWRQAVHHAIKLVYEQRKDVQLVLSLPLPASSLTQLYTRRLAAAANVLGLGKLPDEPDGIASAFLQLCYPWVITPSAEALPGEVEPPEGVFAGMLARTIPELGAPHSVGRQLLRSVYDFKPELPGSDLLFDAKDPREVLIHRVSLLGRTPDGLRVLSDVTTSWATAHRPAAVGRLTAAILRTARHLGESVTFEPSGERLWARIRDQLERLLQDFYAVGALYGASAGEAYSVRCDATTTTQNDLDNGRVLAEVRFAPSHPVGLIVVVLALREGSVTAVSVPA